MNEKLQELMTISKQHPCHEIQCMVDYEVFCSDEHVYWSCQINRIVVDDYYCSDEAVYVGADEIYEYIQYSREDDPKYEAVSGQAFEDGIHKEIKRLKEIGDIVEKIIVYLGN